MERKTRIKEILSVTLPLVGLLAISFCSFSNQTKKDALAQQNGICPVCGNRLCNRKEGHHRVPRSLGGNDTLENCVIVDGDEKYGPDCHETLDRNVLDHGRVFLSKNQPDVPIGDVPIGLFKNEWTQNKAVKRFRVGEVIEGTITLIHKKLKAHKRTKRNKRRNRR